MTIIYQYRVATASLGGFLKLLASWKGSVYKLLYKETLIFSLLYALVSLVYRLALSPSQKLQMEQVVIHCESYTSFIPLSFVLGFYVTIIVQRWWQQFQNVPWPDRTLFVMCTYLNGQEERSRMMRRSVARYMLFGMLLIMRSVSLAVMKRFPTVDTIVEAGFITKDEAERYERTQCRYLKFWVPLMWANNVLARARREGRIETEFGLRMILEQLADFRDKCSLCFVYDWITIPLVYTQVVTLAVYSFFAACLLGRQFLDPSKGYPGYQYDSYVPVFTLLQFTFYMGWLKVAEQMLNPFGEDDDDYDINWLIDRHTAVAFALVDQCCGSHPPLVRDQFWDETVMPEMPYTEASQSSRRANFLGSSFNINHLHAEDARVASPVDHHPRLRRRSQSSFAGSVLSLFSFKPNWMLSGSRDTLDSADHGGRYLAVPNGRASSLTTPLLPQGKGEKSRSVSLDMSTEDTTMLYVPHTRERSFSERGDGGGEGGGGGVGGGGGGSGGGQRVRKLSSPSRFNFFTKRDGGHKEPLSPKPSRFVVEAVEDSSAHPGEEGEGGGGGGGGRTRRSGLVQNMIQAAGGGGVSRPPLLSAIEEGGTVTSLRQLLGRADSNDSNANSLTVSSLDDAFADLSAVIELEDIHEDQRELDFTDDMSPMEESPLSPTTRPDDEDARLACKETKDYQVQEASPSHQTTRPDEDDSQSVYSIDTMASRDHESSPSQQTTGKDYVEEARPVYSRETMASRDHESSPSQQTTGKDYAEEARPVYSREAQASRDHESSPSQQTTGKDYVEEARPVYSRETQASRDHESSPSQQTTGKDYVEEARPVYSRETMASHGHEASPSQQTTGKDDAEETKAYPVEGVSPTHQTTGHDAEKNTRPVNNNETKAPYSQTDSDSPATRPDAEEFQPAYKETQAYHVEVVSPSHQTTGHDAEDAKPVNYCETHVKHKQEASKYRTTGSNDDQTQPAYNSETLASHSQTDSDYPTTGHATVETNSAKGHGATDSMSTPHHDQEECPSQQKTRPSWESECTQRAVPAIVIEKC